jgi:phosphoglucomutase
VGSGFDRAAANAQEDVGALGSQECQDGEDATVVVGRDGQTEADKDAANVRLDSLGAEVQFAGGEILVSSSMIDLVVDNLRRRLVEVPWGSGGSWTGCSTAPSASAATRAAGTSFLRRDGSVCTTDKDGIVVCLLAVEIGATGGHDPGVLYDHLADRLGRSAYRRIDAPARAEQKDVLKRLSRADRGAGACRWADHGRADLGARQRGRPRLAG